MYITIGVRLMRYARIIHAKDISEQGRLHLLNRSSRSAGVRTRHFSARRLLVRLAVLALIVSVALVWEW